MQVLSRFGELAWFSLPAETHPVYGYPQVPYMGWRYASPREGVAQLIEHSVSELQTQVEWTLDRTKRNWLLLPSRILSEAQGLDNPGFADVVHSINVHDQNFCFKALSDLELIIQSLQEVSIPEG
ncbi:hypothetical protein [Streptomyces acidicola]|uniref:Uncharacterized protein n=1 Tax=Streptomyces acidicola TaxID=2596892 RepID=A0A5N8WUS7_9ACTN|nr:hypothetical protein [Streptomyces acidicola]MPY50288.1 hypothetical protein [Streptomyces acidicola]